jgi:long-chain acyl-CoA synthetase
VITFNRPSRNRAGTVGESLPGVAVRIAGDGEVLVRGPNVTPGYYLRPEETAAAFDDEGWFRTGDLGEFDAHGFLRITDRMDNLFKLSTGQYVTPQPMETRLMAEPLVSEAVVVGAGHKFATALVFPNPDNLRAWADLQRLDSNLSPADLLGHPRVLSRFERMVDDANRGMSDWSTIKGFRLLLADLTVDNQMLTPTLKVRRRKLHEVFADEIEKLYSDGESAP